MKDDIEFIKIYLDRCDKKREKLHEKSGYESRAWKFEELIAEQRVLQMISDFLWKQLPEQKMSGINFELLQEMIDCVKREVKMRYAVYPARVRNRKMTNDEMIRECQLMYAVQKALQRIYDDNVPAPVQQSFLNAQEFIQEKFDKYRG